MNSWLRGRGGEIDVLTVIFIVQRRKRSRNKKSDQQLYERRRREGERKGFRDRKCWMPPRIKSWTRNRLGGEDDWLDPDPVDLTLLVALSF